MTDSSGGDSVHAAATPGAHYTLSLLGGVELRGAGDATPRLLVQSKIVALLAYLAVPSLGRFVRRDRLAGLLWPELDQARARKAVRQSIHEVRSALGADALIGRGDEEIALAPERVWCDVAAFSQAADAGFLMQALQLYRGELMPGFYLAECGDFDHWLEEERAVARERASAVAWALAKRLESDHQLSDAALMARRALRFSWSDERALRRALVMLDRLGDRASAAQLYDEFAKRLRTELDITPSDDTMQLIARIRSGAPPNPM